MWIHIASVVVISFFVGIGCFQWGENKAKDELQKEQWEERDKKNKQEFQERERANKQYELSLQNSEKELNLIKHVAKIHNIKLNNIQIKGIQFMLKDKYCYVPTNPDEIYKFIRKNILNIKEQE